MCETTGDLEFVRLAGSDACTVDECYARHLDLDLFFDGVGTYAPNPSMTEYPMDAGEFDVNVARAG